MSPSLGSPDALYHVIPQADAASELEGDTGGHPISYPPNLPPSMVDTQIRMVYFFLGAAFLLPWNVVITAMPYFLGRLSNSPLQSSFSSYLTSSFTLSNFIFLAHATLNSKRTIPSRMAHSCLVWLIILNLCLTISTFFVLPPGLFFSFAILNAVVQATFGSYLQTCVVAVASLFGPPAIQAMVSGQAAAAVVISGVQVISAAASVWGIPRQQIVSDGSAEERSAFIFFSLSTLFLAATTVLHRWMIRTPLYQDVAAALEKRPEIHPSSVDHEEIQGLMAPHAGNTRNETSEAFRVAKLNIVYEIAVAGVFMITLAVFPPITTSIQPNNPLTHPLLFTAIHFLVFNTADFLGRYVCSFPEFTIWSGRKLLAFSAARVLFIPLFLMCNVQRSSSGTSSAPVISSDFIFMLLLFIFGWSNGYVSSLCLMAAPSLNHNPRLKGRIEDVDVAATVVSFFLVGGLVVGSFSSFAVKGAICGCNPFRM